MTTATCICICCLSIAASPGDVWPGFRGTGDSVSLAESVPVNWSDESVAWRASLPGYGQSSPVVFDRQIFVTSMLGPQKETASIVALNLAGEKVWNKEFPSTQSVKASGMVSRGAPTPWADDERIYALFESGDLVAIDHRSNVAWQRSLVKDFGKIQGNHGIASSIVANDKFVFALVNHDGPSYLVAFDKSNGKTVWKNDYENRVSWSSPVITRPPQSDVDLLIVSGGGRVDAYHADDGHSIWKYENIDGNTVPSATVAAGQVWIGSSKVGHNFALPLRSDGLRLTREPVVCDQASCTFSSPLCHNGNVYFVSRAGVAYCNDQRNGRLNWKSRIAASCWASHVAAADHVYFFSKNGTTTVVQNTKEFAVVAENKLTIEESTRVYGVAIVNNHILFRTGTELICVTNKNLND